MAIYGRTVRRGLPRVTNGQQWPPTGDAPLLIAEPVENMPAEVAGAEHTANVAARAPKRGGAEWVEGTPEQARKRQALRQGLPRLPDGKPWPPATIALDLGATGTGLAPVAPPPARAETTVNQSVALRRGMPRAAAGELWPPVGLAPRTAAASQAEAETVTDVGPAAIPKNSGSSAGSVDEASSSTAVSASAAPPLRTPRIGLPSTGMQWVGAIIVGGGGLLGVAAMAGFLVRAFMGQDFMQDFMTTYPGEYHLPDDAPVGLPAWLGWQHFFNAFFIVLIIRTGLQVRTEKRPTVFLTPRNPKKAKTSLTSWLHQSLDILWLVNGVLFVVLLFVTGQWMRIVPTSWEVFPNALSAALQYLSLDWPTENGWVNYNALQQLAYFVTVFIAAPLATVTGYRMSQFWPKDLVRLNRAYPIEWARTLHFPVMLYFVAFVIMHVALVFATGALRNLNHMYAAQGSPDPAEYADNWAGFWIFAASVALISGACVAARPIIIAPVARLFGTVSSR